MRILLDCRFQTGAGPNVTTRYLVEHMLAREPGHEFLVLQHRGQRLPDWPGVETIEVPTSNPLLEFGWVQTRLPGLLRRRGIDICHSLKHVGPLVSSVPTIQHVREVGHFLPEGSEAFRFDLANHVYWNHVLVQAVRRATHVVAISNECRDLLISRCRVPGEKITVNYHGVDADFRPLDDERAIAASRERLGLPARYVLCVSSPYPHKNYDTVLAAYARVRDGMPDPPGLVIVGDPSHAHPDFFELMDRLRLREHVVFPGYLGHDDLVWVYNGAELLLYPPMLGSFGNPPVEAMACGLPVIVSDRGALPEVADGAALVLARPRDVDEMAAAVTRLLTDGGLRDRLRGLGLERARDFTWPRSADGMLAVYDAVAGRGAAGAAAGARP